MEDYLVYLDETGDHNLQHIDRQYPIFALGAMICTKQDYITKINPSFDGLKYEFFGKRHIALHSTCIRNSRNEFSILRNPQIRTAFFEQLNKRMIQAPYQLVISAVNKYDHNLTYSDPKNPYSLTLGFILERLFFLIGRPNGGRKGCQLIAESRDDADNIRLERVFDHYLRNGTGFVSSTELQFIKGISFVKKEENETGHQIVDLCLYPTARTLLSASVHPSMPYFYNKLYKRSDGLLYGYGLKYFPSGIQQPLLEEMKKCQLQLTP